MSHNNHAPRISPTERYLSEKATRFAEPNPAMIVRISDIAAQLPSELALDLIRRRKASVIVDPAILPALILGADEIDDALEAQLLGTVG
jgi:hypothetical protein